MTAWFTGDEQVALRDFWVVYERHYAALSEQSRRVALAHPEFGPLMRSMPAEVQRESEIRSRAMLSRAMDGEWDIYEADLRQQADTYAQFGISFAAWFDLAGQLRNAVMPHLIAEYGAQPERLSRVITTMQSFFDRALAILGDRFIDAKEALRRAAEDRQSKLFEQSPVAMYVFDLETLRFLTVNDAAVRQYGYSREEFARLTIEDIRLPEDVPKLREALEQLPDLSTPGRFRHRRKDGKTLWVEVVGHAFDFDGRRARLIAAHDVTERDSLAEQLRQSQKMEAIGQLAGGVAHDFNNLLTVILSFSQFAQESLPADHEARADIREVIATGQRAATLTKQLLAFSRRDVIDPHLMDLKDVVVDSEKMLRRLIGEDVQLAVSLPPDLNLVMADRGHIEQVLLNLVVNARDAMPEGGRLTIEASNAELDATYVRGHLGAKAGAYVMLAVTDTGVGMDEATQARIFEPFFTTKAPGKGTGLGLSTVFGIVKQAGGDIRVYSSPFVGTTFKIYFPAAMTRERAVEAPRAATSVASRGETILLVEDEAAVRMVARRALMSAGYELVECASPTEALKRCNDREGKLSLLLTDVVMPEMNGRQLADAILKIAPHAKVMFMSGYTGGAMVHQGIIANGEAYLQKPFTPQLLLEKVRAVLDGAESRGR